MGKGLEEKRTVKGPEQLKPWEESKLEREFFGRGIMSKSNFEDCKQRDVLLVVCGIRTLDTADTPTH